MGLSEELVVRKIRDGTVIDHIPAGQALNVLRIMGIKGLEGNRIAIVMNVESKKLGKKDIVKIENREIAPEEINKIALIAPNATINIIRDYKVIKKEKVTLPDKIKNIVKCINPTCITNQERESIISSFKLISKNPIILLCEYCERYLLQEDIIKQFE
ncbi:MAG: aspartate carbamoyltransferase regulatory subunit [Candidatus Aenigmatarchaeota archaeon]